MSPQGWSGKRCVVVCPNGCGVYGNIARNDHASMDYYMEARNNHISIKVQKLVHMSVLASLLLHFTPHVILCT